MLDRRHERLKAARIAAGYRTALEFSSKHGLKQPTYSAHETGERGLRKKVAERYAKILSRELAGITSDWLLDNIGEPPVGILPPAESKKGSSGLKSRQKLFQRQDGTAQAIEHTRLAEILVQLDYLLAEENLNPDTQRRVEIAFAVYECIEMETEARPTSTPAPVNLDRYRPLIRILVT